ncbi:MAG: hypothetical protein K8T26_06100 [Lentisphaerae bacterium]|nr:hypothetical protein [Lentisphaerota bacterium]
MRKTLKKAAFVIACLVTLVGLFYAVENWRGYYAWTTYRREREAKGDRFEWSSVVPPAVPDAENLAMTPLFAELFATNEWRLNSLRLPDCEHAAGEWSQGRTEDLAAWRVCFSNDNLIGALQTYEPTLAEVEAALRLPKCRFPIRYEDNYTALLPHLSVMRDLARIFKLRAVSELEAGDTGAALGDVQKCLRLADAVKDEPLLVSFLVRKAMVTLAIQPVWQGIVRRQWNAEQLAELQSRFGRLPVFDQFRSALRAERVCGYTAIQSSIGNVSARRALFAIIVNVSGNQRKLSPLELVVLRLPTGWFYQNMLFIDRHFTESLLPAMNWENRRVDLQEVSKLDSLLFKTHTPYNILAKLFVPAVVGSAKGAAEMQAVCDQVAIACALERYRLAKGELPDTLSALVPQFLERVPTDVIRGEPLHYKRTTPDQYVLYSVGWNGTDDGGTIAWTQGEPRRQDIGQGDWVWFSQPVDGER